MSDRIMTEAADQEAGADRAVEQLMTLAEAAAAIGRAPESVRTMIRRGKLKATKGNDGRWLVAVPVAMRRQPGQPVNGAADGDPTALDRAVGHGDRLAGSAADSLIDRLTELEAVTDDLRLEVEHWRARAEQDALVRVRAEGRLEAVERAHAAEVAALRELVAELRRPWWRRWLGKGEGG